MNVIDGHPAKQKIEELGLSDLFDTAKDKRVYDNESFRIIVFFGVVDKFNRQRKKKEQGFVIIECKNQLEYSDALDMALNL